MKTSDFDYVLPPESIAARPAARRDWAKLMVLDRATGARKHSRFDQLGALLPPASLLVVNDTRVIPARLRARKSTGGVVEILLTRRVDPPPATEPGQRDVGRQTSRDDSPDTKPETQAETTLRETWEGLARGLSGGATGRPQLGFGRLSVEVLERRGQGRVLVRLETRSAGASDSILAALEEVGRIPLPPYIEAARRQASPGGDQDASTAMADRERYQTVYAAAPGAVAAPTAGLHFTPQLLSALKVLGHEVVPLTLHVGPGTFRPVETDDVTAHDMEEEHYVISDDTAEAVNRAVRQGRPVVAVGTTVVRALESAARARGDGAVTPGPGASRLFLRPGDLFLVVSDLITNFHLPRSTLLMLVAAFAGRQTILAAYEDAIARGYRFYSYGDAMFITSARAPGGAPSRADGA